MATSPVKIISVLPAGLLFPSNQKLIKQNKCSFVFLSWHLLTGILDSPWQCMCKYLTDDSSVSNYNLKHKSIEGDVWIMSNEVENYAILEQRVWDVKMDWTVLTTIAKALWSLWFHLVVMDMGCSNCVYRAMNEEFYAHIFGVCRCINCTKVLWLRSGHIYNARETTRGFVGCLTEHYTL